MNDEDRNDLEQLLVAACDVASALKLTPSFRVACQRPYDLTLSLHFFIGTIVAMCERHGISADIKDYGGDPTHALDLISNGLCFHLPNRNFKSVLMPQG